MMGEVDINEDDRPRFLVTQEQYDAATPEYQLQYRYVVDEQISPMPSHNREAT